MEVKVLGQYKFGEQTSADLKILLITVIVLSITVVAILYFSKRKPLLIRKITSLSLLFLSIASALTGIALLLLPGKRLEESALLGLTRSTWTWWHSFTSILLIGFIIIHLYLNIDPLKRYLGLSKHENKSTSILR